MKAWTELTPLEQAHEIYSDMHKDAYGFRPRNDVSTWTLQDFEAEFKIMQKQIHADMEQEKIQQEKACHEFEMTIQNLLSAGAKDRTMAIKWLNEANDTNSDNSYLEYLLNLPYGYLKIAS
jgi:hypothetical protein